MRLLALCVGFLPALIFLGLILSAAWSGRPPSRDQYPLRAWQFRTDYCERPMVRALDPETLEPIRHALWIPMPKFTGLMHVRNGILYARDPDV